MRKNKTFVVSCALTVLSLAAPALAGPPFICHQFEISSTASLPWVDGDYLGMRGDYDITRVVADTQALLKPDMPTIARMETLRRAVLYASRDRALAERLVAALAARVDAAGKAGRTDALAIFDLGYALEAINEIETLGASWERPGRARARGEHDAADGGRALILRARATRRRRRYRVRAGADLEEAEAAATAKARAAAKQDRLLAANMARLQMLQ
jgi:hypothetical protein